MSGAIDFPEYLDVDLSTRRKSSTSLSPGGESTISSRRPRSNSCFSRKCQDCDDPEVGVVGCGRSDCNGNHSTRKKSSIKNQTGESMAIPRSSVASITSLKQSLEKSLGLNNGLGGYSSGLIPNEELQINADLPEDYRVQVSKGSGENAQKQDSFLQAAKSASSLQSIESMASFASSMSLSRDNLYANGKGEKAGLGDEEDCEIIEKGCFRKYLGLFLTLLSGLLYSLAALLVKLLKDDYHPFMISIWRFQGVFAPSILLVLYRVGFMKQPDFRPVWPLKDREKIVAFTVLMLRGILGCWSVVLQFLSLQYLEVADSMVITSSTSVFVTLLAHCFIGEKCAIVPIITALLTMAGVVVISRPPMLTGKEAFDTEIVIGVGMALGCMILAAAILVIQRYLRNAHFSLISLSSGVWGTFQCVILTFAIGVFKLPENSTDALYGVALAVLTFFAQSFIVIALKFEQAGPVAVVQSCDVIFAFLWQFAFLGVVPDYFSLIGSLIIIAGLLLTAFRKCLTVLPEDNRSRRRFRFLLM